MSIIEAELGEALYPGVHRKANRTGKLRSSAGRVAKREPSEVMVKVTGFGKGAAHVKSHLTYITRHGEVELENDRGEIFKGKEEVKSFFKDWEKDFGDSKAHKNQRDTMHMVLSMPASVEPEAVKEAVRDFAKKTFSKNHEYAFALHTDADHPHCHLTVKCLGFNGRRLNPRKADLQQWRETFAGKMLEQGYDAEATPRAARGVVKKAISNVIRHIESTDKTHPTARVAKVTALKVREAVDELLAEAAGEGTPAKPWEVAIARRLALQRAQWLRAAEALENHQPLRFTGNGLKNDRPDYDRLDHHQARAGQRHAAALHQSGPAESRPRTAAGTLASLRDLSGIDVVHDGRRTESLLQSNAHAFLAGGDAPGDAVRRPGTGPDRTARGPGAGAGPGIATEPNAVLASRIRGFAEALPEPGQAMTAAQELRRGLARQFTRGPAIAAQPAAQPTAPGIEPAAPAQPIRGQER